MQTEDLDKIFSKEVLEDLLPPQISDQFFDALYGDADEGAYDISLSFNSYEPENNVLSFDLRLRERPDKCLSCNLTFGLPQVFSRHPMINIAGLVEKICALLGNGAQCVDWQLGSTQTPAADIHSIPLTIQLG
jgi:hypothetical protein